ncbi:MAG TPA: pyridoxamine 5'-phosphate oxidase family protein [Acidimicrobiia bacterium]|nr:pyridoxamine 5'-phosphate oxidase family protein [Acidimicrobiia bacterium]
MSAAEVGAFLQGHDRLALATNGPGGFPHVVAMAYGLLGGRIAFWGDRRSVKMCNLARDPRLGLLIEESGTGDDHGLLRGVHLAGRADLVDDPGRMEEIADAILVQRFGTPDRRHLPTDLDVLLRRRVGALVTVERTASWDHTKAAGG